MANKLILVPEEKYRGLLSQNNYHAEDLLLNYTKDNVEKIKRTRNKNVSTKKALYDHEVAKYLKMRK